MRREGEAGAGPVVVPGVTSLQASSRRTLKHGESFALFDELGDVLELERSPLGLFHRDMRYLSRLVFTLEGHRPLVLSSTVQADNVLLDVDLTNPDLFVDGRLALAKDTFHVARAKFLWQASCQELFTLTSYAERPRVLRFAIEFGADFADLFEIRGHRRPRRGALASEVLGPAEARLRYKGLDGLTRATYVGFSPAPRRLDAGRAEFELELAPRARRALWMRVHCQEGGAPPPAERRRFFSLRRRSRREHGLARARMAGLQTSNRVVNGVLERSAADLAMLTTETGHGPFPYAGVPWFSTAFGRDGLLTAMQTLWLAPSLGRGVLRFLAAHQAMREDGAADMEPGKILHELRECELARLGEVPFGRYYGSIDATPLFVALAGMYWARTHDRETLEAIWPNVKAALAWIERHGDRDGDGFVEYTRQRASGLANQGWKDSDDAIFHADGSLAEGPIALCEVQAYVYLALRQAASLARDFREPAFSRSLDERADGLRERFEAAFWDEEIGTYALALDGEKRRCRVRSSNAGQVLFSGIAREDRAARVAAGLAGRDFFTGWGVRTVSSREARFNPASYHNGSVWPHDNALIAIGLARYGHAAHALQVTAALFDAAAHMHLRRLPELFCGFPRKRAKAPTLYPVACAPQAWAAAAPYGLLQACLGIEIDCAAGALRLRRPRLPEFIDSVALRGLRVGGGRLDLELHRTDSSVAVSLLEREGTAEIEVLL